MLQAVADIVRTTLGPRAMLKMLLDASGGAVLSSTLSGVASSVLSRLMRVVPCAGIILTNDGNAILREIDVSHPAAKVWPFALSLLHLSQHCVWLQV